MSAVLVIVALAVGIGVWWHARSRLPTPPAGWKVVDHVADGDTIVLGGGTTVRLVQIDTPEVFFHGECFGEEASAETKELLHRGTFVRLGAIQRRPPGTPMAACCDTSSGRTASTST